MINLERLKSLIDENNFPYFDDTYLQLRIDEAGEPPDLYALAKELCIIKAGIEEMKLGGHHNTKPQETLPCPGADVPDKSDRGGGESRWAQIGTLRSILRN
jgi:hypothetical protein